MKLINKKNFLPMVCMFYTFLSLIKVVLENFILHTADENQTNFLWMFVISVVTTFIISLHYYLQGLPVWLVIIGQYIILLLVLMLSLWISGEFNELHPDAYRDLFISFTIPYIMGAAIYYIRFWFEVKRANTLLRTIKNNEIR